MEKYCFGIDVGGTTVKCGLFENDGTVVDKWEIRTHVENQGERILPDIADTVLAKIQEKGLDKSQVAGIGIGLPGPIEENGEIACAVNLHWGRKNIEKELGDMTGLRVKAGNDANVAALGEMWKGGGKGSKNLILATLGTGVGGGIIVNEKIVTGAHGAGGEIGHASVNPDETVACNCGNKGCLEQYASATGIARLARKAMEGTKKPSSLRYCPNVSAKDVFDAYKEGDELAAEIVEEFSEYMGRALAVFACVSDPDVIVLGGGVSRAGQPLIDCVEKHYKKYAFTACKETPIRLATLGNDAGVYGAAKLVLSE
ncbi:MAG TPA: ROK family glucokinase [Candidatus Blautia merdigallinarum]|uniref:Glucokinase n=1 Tax=Candidatus Blautia merdigallinarum TaxID=2838495 RepID=A0A9D2N6V8_9FIRM|nr:ROK family glucokinase [Candidatus Blautia merdigallinarum]